MSSPTPNGKTQMVTKGAVEEVLGICTYVEVDGQVSRSPTISGPRFASSVAGLNADGLRVVAVAQKTNPRTVG